MYCFRLFHFLSFFPFSPFLSLTNHCPAFAWAWLENQLAVACKALPLGHTAGQRVIDQLRPALVDAVNQALSLDDDELGPVLPGLALASALHETQYSRLFRS
mgnify:CR=1 FL=1